LSQEVSTGAIATPIMGDVEILIGKVDDILDKFTYSPGDKRAMSTCAVLS